MGAGWKNCSRTHPCEVCRDLGRVGKGDKARCGYTDDGAYHCFRGAGQPLPGWRIVKPMAAHGGTVYRRSDDPRVARELSAEDIEKQRREEEAEYARKVAKARAVWGCGADASDPGGVAARYFAGRVNLEPCELPASIRFAASLAFYDDAGNGAAGPAVLCGMTDPVGDLTACHRIYLEPGDAAKPVKRKGTTAPKQMLGKPNGSAVRFPAMRREGERTVIVCEGIETGYALWRATGCRTLACYSGAGMMNVVLDGGEAVVDAVIVAGDYDELDRAGTRPGERMAAVAANNIWSKNPSLKAVAVVLPSHGNVPEAIDIYGAVVCGTKGVDWEDVARFWGLDRVAAIMRDGVRKALDASGSRKPGVSQVVPTAGAADHGVGGGEFGGALGPRDGEPALMPKGDLARARMMIGAEAMFGRGGERYTIVYDYADRQWYRWVGDHYERLSEEEMRSRVLRWAEPYCEEMSDGKIKKVGMSARAAENVVKSLQTDAGVRVEDVPCWVPPTIDAKLRPLWETTAGEMPPVVRDPEVVIPLRDGLLSVDAWLEGEVRLLPHSPRYLSSARPRLHLDVAALAAYRKADPHCEERGGKLVAKLAPKWLEVIQWASDGDAVWQECMGRAFGISMTPDTSMERIFFMEGPPGSSKGTIFEGLISMLGEDLVATSSLTDVCEKFEASAWRGRRVVGMTDASVGKYTDPGRAVEIIKRISGSDPIAVEKKYRDKQSFWRPRLHLWIVANDLLRLPDKSLSLKRRLVAMPTTTPVGEKQDPRVKEAIRGEGAGILVWAMCHLLALRRDQAAGRAAFVLPDLGREAIDLFGRNSSPVAAFVGDCCRADPTSGVSAELLYGVFKRWSHDEGGNAMTKESFGAALRSLVPGLARKRMTVAGGGRRPWAYFGIRPLMLGESLDGPVVERREVVMDSMMIARHLMPDGQEEVGGDFSIMGDVPV